MINAPTYPASITCDVLTHSFNVSYYTQGGLATHASSAVPQDHRGSVVADRLVVNCWLHRAYKATSSNTLINLLADAILATIAWLVNLCLWLSAGAYADRADVLMLAGTGIQHMYGEIYHYIGVPSEMRRDAVRVCNSYRC